MIKAASSHWISFFIRLWLYTACILSVLTDFDARIITGVQGNIVVTIADSPTQPPTGIFKQQGFGATILFNKTKSLQCDVSEKTPGYITTIFLTNPPFTFGCLSKDTLSYYFTVALSGVNFPITPVWLANRYHPVKDNASLSLTTDGSLVLRDADGTDVWSTMAIDASGLRLTNTGNLVLFDHHNSNLWESFSEPVDLLVPTQFLQPGSMLVAGFSSHVLPTGSFTAVMKPGGLIFFENSTSKPLPYYALKYPLIPTTTQDVLTSPCNSTQLQLTQVNLTQVQMSYSAVCMNATPSSTVVTFDGAISFVRLEPNGVLKGYYPDHKPAYDVFNNITEGLCGFPNVCGPYGICEGSNCVCPGNDSDNQLFVQTKTMQFLLTSIQCTPRFPLICQHGNTEGQHFLDMQRVDYFANDFITASMSTDSFGECKAACAATCTCRAAFYRGKSKQCFLHESVMSMIRVNNEDYMGSIKLQKPSPKQTKSEMGLIVGISIATMVSVCFFAVWYFYHKGKTGLHKPLNKDEVELLSSLPGQPKRFTFKELQTATWDFNQKLGVGGFGSVYKGVLPDGSSVAVKQLESTTISSQGMKEFRNEVIALSNINHQNLVHLRGFCADGVHRLLVYEYVPNGSLDTWLFRMGGKCPGPPLDWKTRLTVAVHTARGLVFLHEQCRNRIVHLDVKPQNILLDESFIPKLSDFGLSRLINEDQDSAISRMRGTPGYMAPECLILTDATEKSDVYSFGMVLLEIVSGRKNVDVSRLVVHGDGEGWYFPALAARRFKEGQVHEIIDNSLGKLTKDELGEVIRVIKIAFWCIQDDPARRPTIGKALLMLEGYSQVAYPPLSFHFGMRFHRTHSLASSPQTPPKITDKGLESGDDFQQSVHHVEDERDDGEKEDQPMHDQEQREDQESTSRALPLSRLETHLSFPHYQSQSILHPSALSPCNSFSQRASSLPSPLVGSPLLRDPNSPHNFTLPGPNHRSQNM